MLYFVIYHCLLLVQKIKVQKFSAILKKPKANFVLERSHTIFLNKGRQTHLRIFVDANVCTLDGTHERGNQLSVLHSLLGLPGQRC